jgi:hypothetical protein
MNLSQLERKLISAARANPPSEQVPFAFEQRILARLGDRPAVDIWELWSRALWRGAATCTALMLLLGAWSCYLAWEQPPATDLSQEFDNTVLAATDQEQGSDSVW